MSRDFLAISCLSSHYVLLHVGILSPVLFVCQNADSVLDYSDVY